MAINVPGKNELLQNVCMSDLSMRHQAQLLFLESFIETQQKTTPKTCDHLRKTWEQILKNQDLSALDLVRDIAEQMGEFLDEPTMQYGEVFIVIWYKSIEIATRILQPPTDIKQEDWNQALENFFKANPQLNAIFASYGRPTTKKTLASSLFAALVGNFVKSKGLDPNIFDQITTTIIEGAQRILEEGVNQARSTFGGLMGEREVRVEPITNSEILAEDRLRRIEKCERALEFLTNRPGCCTPALIEDLEKHLQTAKQYGNNPRALAKRGYHQAHFAFPKGANFPIEEYSFMRAKYPRHKRESISSLEIAMIISIEKLFEALNPKEDTDGLDNLVQKTVHALECIKAIGCVPNIEIHGINLEPIDDLLYDVSDEMSQRSNNFQPGTEIHVDETLLVYHFIRGAFQAAGEPDGDIFDKPTRDRVLGKITEVLDAREQGEQTNINKPLISHFFARADELLIKQSSPPTTPPPTPPTPPPPSPPPHTPETPEEKSEPIDLITLSAFARQHFTLTRGAAKTFKPEKDTVKAQEACLQRANIPAGEIQADVATNTGKTHCKRIERVRLERYAPEGAPVSNLNCRARVYLRYGKNLFELICDIDAEGKLTPLINDTAVDVSTLPQETRNFFANLKLIIAVGWERILVTVAPKAVLRAPKTSPASPPAAPTPIEEPTASGEPKAPEKPTTSPDPAPTTYAGRVRAGFAVDIPTATTAPKKTKTRKERLDEKMGSLLPILTKTTPITIEDLDSLGNITFVKKEFITPGSDETVFVPIQNPEEVVTRLEAIRTSSIREGLEDLFVCMQPGYTRILPYTSPDPTEGTLTQKAVTSGKLSEIRRRHLEQQGLTLSSGQRTTPYPLKIDVDPRETTRVMLETRDSAGRLTAIPLVVDDLIGLKEKKFSTSDGVSDGASRIEDTETQIHLEYGTEEIDGVQHRIVTRVIAIIPDVERSIGYAQGDMISIGDLLRKTGNL